MTDVTGPISTLPGALHALPEGTMCDEHPDRPAIKRVQGETDSFGSEMHDLCAECFAKDRAEARQKQVGNCDWCKATDVPLRDARDYEEGLCGRVYQVCKSCKERQDKRLQAEAQRYDHDDDYDDDDYWCERCHNTGALDCHCGGDLCVCANNGSYPCPDCSV